MVKRVCEKLLLLLGILLLCYPLVAEQTIHDSFDSGLEKWGKPGNRFFKLKDGMLINDTAYSSSIGLKEKNIGEFTLSFKLKLLPGAENLAGHFSIGINRGYGSWRLYITRNTNSSRITSQFLEKDWKRGDKALFKEATDLELPMNTWIEVRIIARKDRYELKIGDNTMILGTAPGFGGVGFSSYRQPVAIDDFKVVYSKPEALSENLQINGSFEHATNPDVPDYWAGTGHQYRTNGLPNKICTAKGLKEYREKFYLDNTQAKYGKKSMRIEYPFHLLSKGMKVKPKQNYTVSCYIKSDIENRRVQIGATLANIRKPLMSKIIDAGKNWKRYEFCLPDYPNKSVSFFVKPLDSGKVWIDAVQIEQGKKATPFTPCWYDTGFNLPFDVNKNQYQNNVMGIRGTLARREIVSLTKLKISLVRLSSTDPATHKFSLNFDVVNQTSKEQKLTVVAGITAKKGKEQFRTSVKSIAPGKSAKLEFKDFRIKDLRCCVNVVLMDPDGKVVKQLREFMDVPHPLRIYPEYSFYTTEKEARIVAEFACAADQLKGKKLELITIVSGYPSYPCLKNEFELKPKTGRQIFSIPVSSGKLRAGQDYTVIARVVDGNKKMVMQAEAELEKRIPHITEVKINRINRGVYVNGEPFIPYGILISNFQNEQLRYYRKCGFDYLCFLSSWQTTQKNLEFLDNCARTGINAIAFHMARPYGLSPAQAVSNYKSSSALVGIIPNDESPDRIVYKKVQETKLIYPEIISCGNHNFHSYRAFAERIDGFPGDVLSIDRYPLIPLPPGRPQAIHDLYSVEECIEMMDKDGKRERKPLFFWLQAAERFVREPTPLELTWSTYILLVNHCMGFTYFGGLPQSCFCWERMQSLNKEIQTLKPFLFSLEPELEIKTKDDATRENIRILAKKLGNQLVIIAVNRSFDPIEATFDLPNIEINARDATVMFENRKIKLKNNIFTDRFAPLTRHVYRIRIKGGTK